MKVREYIRRFENALTICVFSILTVFPAIEIFTRILQYNGFDRFDNKNPDTNNIKVDWNNHGKLKPRMHNIISITNIRDCDII